MNEIKIFKTKDYDKFKCTADKCKFTCCAGWDISVDNDTYEKWKYINNSEKTLIDTVKKISSKEEYIINKDIKSHCPHLDDKGLCSIVNYYGEDYLSLTCKKFPRIEMNFEELKVLSLSCSCPEVIDIIDGIDEKIYKSIYKGKEELNEKILSDNNHKYLEDEGISALIELKIREVLINIIYTEEFYIEHKLFIAYEFLLDLLELRQDGLEKDSLEVLIEKYEDVDYMKKLISIYKEVEVDIYESVEEINNLFLDMVENYKEVFGLRLLLKDIYNFSESINIDIAIDEWSIFKVSFEEYNNLIENCIVSNILSICSNCDIKSFTINFQMIILEYLLARYAVFLKKLMLEEEDIYKEHVKDYIMAFSRIIGNNTEAVEEFIMDGFNEELLDLGYLCFIGLF